MPNDDEARLAELTRLLDRIDRLVHEHSIQQVQTGNQVTLAAIAMFSACPSFFRAVMVVIQRKLPGPAFACGRVLFEDALRLGELAKATRTNEALPLALSWFWEANQRAEGLFVHDAVRVGLDDDPRDARAVIEARRTQLLNVRDRNQIGQIPRQTAPKNIAEALGLSKEWWDHDYASQYIHGSELASRERLDVREDQTLAYDPWAAPAASLIAAGGFASQAYVLAWKSLAAILGWHVPEELDAIEAAILALEGRAE